MQDLRVAIRSLAKSPGFTAAAVLTLALGIGANTAIYSVVYGVLQRPLPYRDPASLVLVGAQREFAGETRPSSYSAFEIEEWQERNRTLASLAGYSVSTLAFDGPDGAEPLEGALVSGDFFVTIGQPAATGRLLGPADDLSPVAVVSHRLALRHLGEGASAVGRALLLDGRAYSVVGVAAPDFRLPSDRTDVWIPMGQARQAGIAPWLNLRRGGGVHFVARLLPETPLAAAVSDLAVLAARAAREEPDLGRGRVATVTPIADSVAGGVRPALRLLFAATGLVLLVASANVANLLLARQASRERDVAICLALGASRARLAAHALAEAAIFGLGGCLGGLLLALGVVRTLVWLQPAQLPRLDAVRLDAPVLLFAAAVAVAATLAASLGPALRSYRQDASRALAAGARMAGSGSTGRLRSALVVTQLAAAVLLLVGSSVLARSLVRLLGTDVGARTDHVLVARVELSLGRRLSETQESVLGAALVERVKLIPGVRFASLGAALPPNGRMAEVTLKDLPTARGIAAEYAVNAAPATAEFFPALGIPLLQGRLFEARDDADHPPVVILSADAARDLFGDDPLGRTLPLPTRQKGSVTATVVGVVGNVKYKGLAGPAVPTLYVPFAQLSWPGAFLVARTEGEPGALAGELRRAIGEVDRQAGVRSIETLDAIRSQEAALPGFRTAVLAATTGLSVALAAVGLGGVVGYAVSRRTAEIGVRMALGAARRDVARMVLREGLRLGAAGGVVGLAAAFAFARLLSGFVFEVAPTDPVSFVLAAALLMLLVLLASYLPARRASNVDPVVALRAE